MIAEDNNSIKALVGAGQPLQVYVLGRFEVRQGPRLIENEQWRSGKARNLFKILLARRNYQISRQEVLELLWPELDQERAANNLNQAVYSLRRTLEPSLVRANHSAYLKTEGTRLQLQANLIEWIDLEDFKRLLQQAQLTSNLRLYEQAAALYTGDYLPEDLYEDWAISRRESLRQQWIESLLQMAQLYHEQGANEKYQQCLHQVLETDFANEEAAQKLMQSLTESGRREEALTFYRNFANKLQHRLNLEPLGQTQQLYQDIVAGKITLRPGGGRLVAFPTRITSNESVLLPFKPLVASKLALIGRNHVYQQWQQILRKARLAQSSLTVLTGEAGIGKSVLAQSLAEQASEAGFEVLQVECREPLAGLALGTLSEILEQVYQKLSESQRREYLEGYTNLPLVQRWLPESSDNSVGVGRRVEETLEVADLFSPTARLLATFQRSQPLVIVLDDWQRLPETARQLVKAWLNYSGLRGLVVLATGAETRLAAEASHEIKLERLNTEQLQQLLAERLDQPVRNELFKTISRASQGNPQLAIELAQGWQNAAPPENWWEALPAGVTSYLGRMLRQYSQEAQILIGLAALIGTRFPFEVLRRIVLHRQDGAGWWIGLGPTSLGQTLTELVEAGLITEQETYYCFSYPLLAEAVIASLSYNQRQCWREVIDWAYRGK